MFTSARFSIRYWQLALIAAVVAVFGISAAPAAACDCILEATKSVSGTFEVGSTVTYTVVITNSMPWTQGDNAGDEFTDVLPSQLTLVSASATSGTATPNVGTNTVTWNGSIADGDSVTITINATINAGTGGQVVSNQATISYDGNDHGSNEVSDVTDDPGTIAFGDATVFTVAGVPDHSIEEKVLEAAPPPATPLCETHNFDEGGVVRGSVTDAFGYAVNCRVLYQNGTPTTWLGGALYGESSIGIPGIVELGVQQAVDIFSPPGMNIFNGGAVFCLKGTGTLIWIAASGQPRHAEIIGSYEVPEWEGFTCATLFEPGTLVLVSENPLA